MRLERELLGRAFLLAVAAGVGCVLVATVVGDGGTALSAAVGAALVVGFLGIGQVPVAAAARGARAMGALLLLLGYVSRVLVLLVALVVVRRGEGLDRVAVGLAMMATGGAWTVGAVWAMVRWRPMLVEPVPPDRTPDDEQPGRRADGAATAR